MINRDNSKIEELRSLVLGEQYENALNDYIDNNDEASRVADVIVEAIKQRNQKDNKVTEELSPIIDSAIEVSINNNTQRLPIFFILSSVPLCGNRLVPLSTNWLTHSIKC